MLVSINHLAPKVPEKVFDAPKAGRKIWPTHLRGGGGGASGVVLINCQQSRHATSVRQGNECSMVIGPAPQATQ